MHLDAGLSQGDVLVDVGSPLDLELLQLLFAVIRDAIAGVLGLGFFCQLVSQALSQAPPAGRNICAKVVHIPLAGAYMMAAGRLGFGVQELLDTVRLARKLVPECAVSEVWMMGVVTQGRVKAARARRCARDSAWATCLLTCMLSSL